MRKISEVSYPKDFDALIRFKSRQHLVSTNTYLFLFFLLYFKFAGTHNSTPGLQK